MNIEQGTSNDEVFRNFIIHYSLFIIRYSTGLVSTKKTCTK